MKKIMIGLVLLTVIVSFCFAQAVSITGRVTDPNGKGLSNTVVRMGVAKLYTLTDANGFYALGNGVIDIKQGVTPKGNAFSRPMISGGKVLFSLPENTMQVRICMYDLNGRFVKEVMNRRLSKGNYSVTLDKSNLSDQFYVLRVNIGNAAHVMTLPSIFHNYTNVIAKGGAGDGAKLEKLAAVLDTLRATEPGYSLGITPIEALTGTYNFTLTKTSTWDGDTNTFWGDTSKISKTPITCVILNKTNGAFADSQIYWALGDGGAAHNLKDEPTVNLANNRSGRLYIMLGSPTRTNTSYWDFEEHTCGANTYNGNTTRVDAYGIPMAIRLHCSDGYDNKLGENYHMFYQSRQSLFDEFKNEVPSEFTHLATMRAPYRIPNPGAGDFRTGGAQEHYWDKYVDTVWSTLGYTRAKPGAYLNGLGDAPSISAGLHRHVMLRPQSDWGNDKYHYQQAPCNFYSYFLHRRSLQRRCYGFPYDDAYNWAAYMSHGNCQWLIVAVGQ